MRQLRKTFDKLLLLDVLKEKFQFWVTDYSHAGEQFDRSHFCYLSKILLKVPFGSYGKSGTFVTMPAFRQGYLEKSIKKLNLFLLPSNFLC